MSGEDHLTDRGQRLDSPEVVEEIIGRAILTASAVPAPPTSPDADPDPTRHVSRLRTRVEWIALMVGAIVLALIIKTFVLQAFVIPSSSMSETLQVGDRILVNKVSYDLHEVNYGDIVVFRAPDRTSQGEGVDEYVKRVIGRPGDSVEVIDSTVYVNRARLNEPYLTAGIVYPDEEEVEVPPGHVFVMGDNRPYSEDSRVFGPIPADEIVGRVFLRIWPPSDIGFL